MTITLTNTTFDIGDQSLDTSSWRAAPTLDAVRAGVGAIGRWSGGESVARVQMRLAELGFGAEGGVDGRFGAGTEQAVREFQRSYNETNPETMLAVDGVVGPMTYAAMFDAEPQLAVEPPTAFDDDDVYMAPEAPQPQELRIFDQQAWRSLHADPTLDAEARSERAATLAEQTTPAIEEIESLIETYRDEIEDLRDDGVDVDARMATLAELQLDLAGLRHFVDALEDEDFADLNQAGLAILHDVIGTHVPGYQDRIEAHLSAMSGGTQ